MHCRSTRALAPDAGLTVGWLSVSFDERPAHRLGALGSLKIALGRGDDGALHQDVPGPGEVVDIDQADRCGAFTGAAPASVPRRGSGATADPRRRPSRSSTPDHTEPIHLVNQRRRMC